MAWISPVTDRSYVDIANRTSKAFMNTSDFERIDGNTDVIRALLDDLYGLVPAHTDPTAPTIETIPHRSLINDLIGNINACSAAAIVSDSKRPAALPTYSAGSGPNWQAVNAWEQALATLYQAVPLAAAYWLHTGVPAAGQDRAYQARWRSRRWSANLVANGMFDSDVSGWTLSYGSLAWVSGAARLYSTGTAAAAYQAVSAATAGLASFLADQRVGMAAMLTNQAAATKSARLSLPGLSRIVSLAAGEGPVRVALNGRLAADAASLNAAIDVLNTNADLLIDDVTFYCDLTGA